MTPQTITRTTTKRAKAQYHANGPQITPTEQRRLARGAELDRRAQMAKDREQRKKQAEKQRIGREKKEQEARQSLGIGLATQLAGYSVSQRAMKGGMEGWLGVAKAKRKRLDEDAEVGLPTKVAKIVESKAEECHTEMGDISPTTNTLKDSFGSNVSWDEGLLDEANVSMKQQTQNPCATTDEGIVSPETMLAPLTYSAETPAITKRSREEEKATPDEQAAQAKRRKSSSSPDQWAGFLVGNTQIAIELSQSPTQAQVDQPAAMPPLSTQDLEINSDDLFETGLPKTSNPAIDDVEGVIVRDFAYFNQGLKKSMSPQIPTAPQLSRKSRTEQSILRSFGRRHRISTASPKMTATCSEFTAAQCSFTTNYHDLGLSTQILQEALAVGDDDTEDEDEEVYSQAIKAVDLPDKVLMPPPPLRASPRVFKPPTLQRSADLFGTSGLRIFGLSTQMLNEAISTVDDDEVTDEDSDDGLFNIPIKRTTMPPLKTPSSATTIPMSTNTFTKTFAPATAPALKHAAKKTSGLRDLGLSTQILHEATLDDIDFTDDDENDDTQSS